MKKQVYTLPLLGLALLAAACSQAGDAIVETLLKREADVFNNGGSKMVDSETRIDSLGVQPGRRLVYYYTLVNYLAKDVDTNVVKQNIETGIANLIAKNEDLRELRKRKVDFCHLYRDRRGKYCFSIDVTPSDYDTQHKHAKKAR